jgi:hypothetical protein
VRVGRKDHYVGELPLGAVQAVVGRTVDEWLSVDALMPFLFPLEDNPIVPVPLEDHARSGRFESQDFSSSFDGETLLAHVVDNFEAGLVHDLTVARVALGLAHCFSPIIILKPLLLCPLLAEVCLSITSCNHYNLIIAQAVIFDHDECLF